MYLINLIVDNFPAIAGSILLIVLSSFATYWGTTKSKRHQKIEDFKKLFTDEREKLKRFDIQNYFGQERAIFEISEYLTKTQNQELKSMWQEYKSTEEQNREATMPNEDFSSSLINYKDDKKEELINKISSIIKFVK